MRISSVSPNVSFGARAKMWAPENVLTKQDIQNYYLKADKIGTDDDVIDLVIGHIHPDEIDNSGDVYDVCMRTNFNNSENLFYTSVNADNFPPKKYLKILLSYLEENYNIHI